MKIKIWLLSFLCLKYKYFVRPYCYLLIFTHSSVNNKRQRHNDNDIDHFMRAPSPRQTFESINRVCAVCKVDERTNCGRRLPHRTRAYAAGRTMYKQVCVTAETTTVHTAIIR